jgi:hypothetical protein
MTPLPGWSAAANQNLAFVEARLQLRSGYDDLTAPIWFVAAPGAVGKSTLAKEISAQTGAVFLDLSKADSVAGNYLTGGLHKNGILKLWNTNETTVLIDALDESRLRVTQGSFEDFISDIVHLSSGRTIPIVIFGRVSIIEEAWLISAEHGLKAAIFDIDFFDTQKSEQFVLATLHRLSDKPGYESLKKSLLTHESSYQQATKQFVGDLEKASGTDGARFFGYAPVLETVATALGKVLNPAALNASVRNLKKNEILRQLVNGILERESAKLQDQLEGIPTNIREKLYTPNEQLERLLNIIPGVSLISPDLNFLTPEYANIYDKAVKQFLPQHPFLDGTGRDSSGAVFGAAIAAHALFSTTAQTIKAAELYSGNGPNTPNPFLIDFYLNLLSEKKIDIVPPEHVAFLYDSVRARANSGDIIRLNIDGADDQEDADVEIQMISVGELAQESRPIRFRTSQAGYLRFGRQVVGVAVDAPQMDVVIGSGNPVELIAPIYLNVARISFICQEIVVMQSDLSPDGIDASVLIEAKELVESKVSGMPLVRKGAELSISWPGATGYPWTSFANGSIETEKDIADILRAFRRLIMAFRSHSKGQLARFRDKIEHIRMTKGIIGENLREKMVSDGILTLNGSMYFLDPDALGRVTGAKFQDVKLKRYSDDVRSYLSFIQDGS